MSGDTDIGSFTVPNRTLIGLALLVGAAGLILFFRNHQRIRL